MLTPGDELQNYIVERALGDGAFASVWLVRHKHLHSLHALKLLDPELALRPRMRERFLSEGQILAQLRHPNLVSVTDLLVTDKHLGLVMAYLEGPTLHEVIHNSAQPLSDDAVRTIMSGLLDGMHFAHERGVVHRDLKPDNVIVVRDGQAARPVILDFGIAKVLEDADLQADSAGKTRMKVKMGTPSYMSPEQLESSGHVDRRTDIWALGAILFELVAGEPAFGTGSMPTIVTRVIRRDFRIPEHVDPAVAQVIERALMLEPEARYPTCADLGTALQQALSGAQPGTSGGPVVAARHTVVDEAPEPPPPTPRDPEPSDPKRPLLTAAIALLGLGLLAGSAAIWRLASTTQPGPQTGSEGAAAVSTPAPTPSPSPSPKPSPTPTATPTATPTPAPTATPVPVKTPTPRPKPTPRPTPTDQQRMTTRWNKHAPAFRSCYKRFGAGKSWVWKLDLTVRRDGTISKQRILTGSQEPEVAAMRGCISKLLGKADFGTLQQDQRRTFTLTYP